MNNYTFKKRCSVCEQQPVLKDVDMCAVCTWGESDALWEWLGEKWYGNELQLAQKYLKQMQRELQSYNMDFAPEINKRVRQILSFKVVKGNHNAKRI